MPNTPENPAAPPPTPLVDSPVLPAAADSIPGNHLDEPGRTARHGGASAAAWAATAILIVIIVAVSAIGAMRPKQELAKPPVKLANVETVTIQGEPYEEALLLPAKVVADREADIGSELAGTLKTWLVAEGARVAAGQPVALLDTATLDAELAELTSQEASARATVGVSEKQLDLARVALSDARQTLKALELDIQSAVADLDLARREHERTASLTEQKISTPAELDTARNRLTQAEIAVDRRRETLAKAGIAVRAAEVQIGQAEAGLAQHQALLAETAARRRSVEVRLAKATLKAPIDGTLEEFLVQAGEVVAPGMPLARLYDLRYVRAQVDVADRYIAFLDTASTEVDTYINYSMKGAERRLQAQFILRGLPKLTGGAHAGLTFDADIHYIAQASDPASNTFRVELRLENPGHALKPGIIGQARIAFLVYPQAIVIPLRAVQVSDRGPRALVVNRDDAGRAIVAVRDIVPVSIQEDRILVVGGLMPGDRLIVAGGKGLVDGEQVNVVVEDGRLLNGGQPDTPADSDGAAGDAR